MPAELILVRHGETTGNSALRLYGATDVPLSELGRRQMRRVRDCLSREFEGPDFDSLWCSPLARSNESARLAYPGEGQEPRVVEAFREIDFGRWEGWTIDEVLARDPAGHAAWQQGDLSWSFPGGDGRRAFRNRVGDAARELFSTVDGRQLAVLHKGVCKVIIGTLTGLKTAEWSVLPCELGSIHRLRRVENRGSADRLGGWRLEGGCEVDHLGDDRLPASR